jgi:hypothetical protein
LAISGITAGSKCSTSECGNFWNATHIATQSPLVYCQYTSGAQPPSASCTDIWYQITCTAAVDIYSNTNHGWTVYLFQIGPDSSTGWAKLEWDSGADTAFNCLTARTLTLDSYYHDSVFGHPCDFSAAACTLTPNL